MVGHIEPVLEDLGPLGQERVQFHHPASGVEDDAGLSLIGGDG